MKEINRREIIRRLEAGEKREDLAEEIGVHPATITFWVKRMRDQGEEVKLTKGRPKLII